MAQPIAIERKSRPDLTSGSVTGLIFRLALPSTLETALMRLIGLVHVFWMGRVGDTAIAAATMGSTLRMALISPMMGLSMGGQAVVAHHLGANEQAEADRAVMQLALLILAFVLPLTVIGLLWSRTFLRWMGCQGQLLDEATGYIRLIAIGLVFTELLPTMNGVIRGAGRPQFALYSNLLNMAVLVVFEPLLALGVGPFPSLGVSGAALATVLGSAAGVGLQMVILISGRAGVGLHLSDLQPDWDLMRRILKIALPNSLERLSPNMANVLFMRLAAAFGQNVLTAFSIMRQIFMVLQAPSQGIGIAAATMVGQNLGAQKTQRAEKSSNSGVLQAGVWALVLFGVLCLFPKTIISWFNGSETVVMAGAITVPYILFAGITQAWSVAAGRALAGAGDAVSPMLANVGALWLVQLPAAWGLSRYTALDARGIWLAMGLGTLASGIAISLRLRQGRWKEIRL